MKSVVKFIKEVQEEYKNGGFDGCWFTKLEGDLYLVFACGPLEEQGLMGKIAYNCDDLQCDYDWDWEISEDRDWEEYQLQYQQPELIMRGIATVFESPWLTAWRNWCGTNYGDEEVWSDFESIEEGQVLGVLYSTFDVNDEEVEIQVSYDPKKEAYIIETEAGTFYDDQNLEGFEMDMSGEWQCLYEYFVGETRKHLYPEEE
jgi:hypothetical protein